MASTRRPSRFQLRTSVRALARHCRRSGDLEVSEVSVEPSLALRIQQEIQGRRPAGYQTEVPVRYLLMRHGCQLEIRGRIDGICRGRHPILVEEIKATRRNFWSPDGEVDPVDWGQLLIYGYLTAQRENLGEIELHLTYVHLPSVQVRTLSRRISRKQLGRSFFQLVDPFLDWQRRLWKRRQERNARLAGIAFPFPVCRPQQAEMMQAVRETIEKRAQLLLEAPTGVGKTAAVLCSSLRALGSGTTEKIIYLSPKTTGKRTAQNGLRCLKALAKEVRSVALTAKEKICFSPDRACSGRECDYAQQFFERLSRAREELFAHNHFSREVIEELGKEYRVCPYFLGLELARWADVVFCDVHYVIGCAKPHDVLLEESNRAVLLIDEAHQLVDRARQAFSSRLLRAELQESAWLLRHRAPAAANSLCRFDSWLAEVASYNPGPEIPLELSSLVEELCGQLEQQQAGSLGSCNGPLTLSSLLHRLRARLAEADDKWAFRAWESESAAGLELICLDPSAALQKRLSRFQSSIFFSATLTPFDYFERMLGVGPDCERIRLGTPYPPENLCVLVADRIAVTWRHRLANCRRVAQMLAKLVEARQGNYLFFFPSFHFLEQVRRAFVESLKKARDWDLVVQSPSEKGTGSTFLHSFSSGSIRPVIGFAVTGGRYAEAIDLAGDPLSGVAVIGASLLPPTVWRQWICHYFDQSGETGFKYAYQIPGMQRVIQAAGRLIRSETDRGVLLLIDQRFSRFEYRELFPPSWTPFCVRDPAELQRRVAQFWRFRPEENTCPSV